MFVKLFSSILDSSVWSEDHATVRVWITMLVMADEDGVVRASNSGLAHRARVSEKELKHGLKVLSEPDLDSKSPEWGGRRIEKIEGGWVCLNYNKYREIRTNRQIRDAERQRRHRARQPNTGRDTSHLSQDVTEGHSTSPPEAEAEAEAEGEAVTTQSGLPARRGRTNVAIEKYLAGVLAAVDSDHQRRVSKKELRAVMAALIFAYWQHKMGHMKALFSKERESRLVRALEANSDNVHELLYTVDGWFRDAIFKKQADEGTVHDSIVSIFKDRDRIERLANHCKGYREEKPHKMAVKYLEGLGV